jgi:hypothetical protein
MNADFGTDEAGGASDEEAHGDGKSYRLLVIGEQGGGRGLHRQDAKSAKKDWEKMLQSGTGKRSTLKDAREEFTGEELMNAFLMR